jgi:hypothetical protein
MVLLEAPPADADAAMAHLFGVFPPYSFFFKRGVLSHRKVECRAESRALERHRGNFFLD